MWGALASLGGAWLGYKGSKQTNIASAQQAQEAEQFSQISADKQMAFQDAATAKQMAFQERMSNTAIQRRMADLKKGGLNPILAGKFDASSPAGAAASGSSATGQQPNVLQNKAQIAMANAHSAANINVMQNQANKLFHEGVTAEGQALQWKYLLKAEDFIEDKINNNPFSTAREAYIASRDEDRKMISEKPNIKTKGPNSIDRGYMWNLPADSHHPRAVALKKRRARFNKNKRTVYNRPISKHPRNQRRGAF